MKGGNNTRIRHKEGMGMTKKKKTWTALLMVMTLVTGMSLHVLVAGKTVNTYMRSCFLHRRLPERYSF